MVDETKLSSSKDYTCIMAGAYTKALLKVHVDVIRKVLIHYPLFLAKRQEREQRKECGTPPLPVPLLTPDALQKVDEIWKLPANTRFIENMVTPYLFLSPPPTPLLLALMCTQQQHAVSQSVYTLLLPPIGHYG